MRTRAPDAPPHRVAPPFGASLVRMPDLGGGTAPPDARVASKARQTRSSASRPSETAPTASKVEPVDKENLMRGLMRRPRTLAGGYCGRSLAERGGGRVPIGADRPRLRRVCCALPGS